MGGARAAAPVAKDVLTYLFDKPKAMAALAALRGAMGRQHRRADGGARRSAGSPRTAAETARGGARREPADGPRLRPGADRRPAVADAAGWSSRIAGFGLLVLYSAAGGSLMPWALPHGVRFVVFLAMAIAMSRIRPQTVQATSPSPPMAADPAAAS